MFQLFPNTQQQLRRPRSAAQLTPEQIALVADIQATTAALRVISHSTADLDIGDLVVVLIDGVATLATIERYIVKPWNGDIEIEYDAADGTKRVVVDWNAVVLIRKATAAVPAEAQTTAI